MDRTEKKPFLIIVLSFCCGETVAFVTGGGAVTLQ
jgi:hypothetical protein